MINTWRSVCLPWNNLFVFEPVLVLDVPHYYKVNNVLFKKRKCKILLIIQFSLIIIQETQECNLLEVLTQGINSKILWIITLFFFQYIKFFIWNKVFYMKEGEIRKDTNNTISGVFWSMDLFLLFQVQKSAILIKRLFA